MNKKIFLLFFIFYYQASFARLIQKIESQDTHCGVLKEFMGEVQLLRQDRKGFLDTKNGSPIPCGAWVSVDQGWADIETKSKINLKLGSYTFLELFDHGEHPKEKDPFTLYRGKVFISSRVGAPGAVISSPHTRAHIKSGEALFLYDSKEEESQLVSFIGEHRLENKFRSVAHTLVRPGEATQMNIKAFSITPTPSKVVSSASLRHALSSINLSKNESEVALQAALKRKDKQTVDIVGAHLKIQKDEREKTPDRVLASTNEEKYSSLEADEKGQKVYLQKIVGGDPAGEKILFPNQVQGKSHNARVVVEDKKKELGLNRKPAQEEEVQRLIRELSDIQVMH